MAIGVIFVVLFYIFCGIPFVFLRPRFRRMKGRLHWPIALSVCATGGFVAALIAPEIVWFLLGVNILPEDWYGRAVVIQTMISVAVGLLIGNYKRAQIRLEMRERELAAAAAKAEAYALQAQISPHFFFNALNSVSALVPTAPGCRAGDAGAAGRHLPVHVLLRQAGDGAARARTRRSCASTCNSRKCATATGCSSSFRMARRFPT